MALSARAEILLKALIERYIADGQPVGSRTLARHAGLDLSPATVRNVMADLEEMGLVTAPHTSAGRVPTERGYRVFVDTLLKIKPLDTKAVRLLKEELRADQDPQQLISVASQLLSEVSRLTGLVTVPRRDDYIAFRQLDFVRLTNRRILVILVTEDGHVQNSLIIPEREFTDSELKEAANYFNETFAGVMISDVRRRLLAEMQQESEHMQKIISLAMSMARQAFASEGEAESVVVTGESNLMAIPDLGDVRKLRRLFEAFSTKQDLLHLLDASMRAGGVKIFIGSESGYDVFSECSLVAAPYLSDGQVIGTLGVIGPTRMAYEQVIPIVDFTSRLLTAALSLRAGGALESSN